MAMAQEGLVDLTTATFGVFGNNIGSCLFSLCVGLAAPLAAKRVAVAHMVLNILGVLVFFPLSHWLVMLARLLSADFATQVALIHTLFNLLSSLAGLTFLRQFAAFILFLIPSKKI